MIRRAFSRYCFFSFFFLFYLRGDCSSLRSWKCLQRDIHYLCHSSFSLSSPRSQLKRVISDTDNWEKPSQKWVSRWQESCREETPPRKRERSHAQIPLNLRTSKTFVLICVFIVTPTYTHIHMGWEEKSPWVRVIRLLVTVVQYIARTAAARAVDKHQAFCLSLFRYTYVTGWLNDRVSAPPPVGRGREKLNTRIIICDISLPFSLRND